MPFQFYCPAGHLLLGDESQAGQVRNCPCCGASFVVPQIGPPPAPPSAWSSVEPSLDAEKGLAPPVVLTPAPPKPPAVPPPEEAVVHIPCPSGHELETPRDMLGQEALCPFCRVQFRLRLEDSIEYRAALQQREREMGMKWMKAAIAAAVVVVGAVILLIGMALSHR